MLAVESGDAKKLAELMRQNPGFKVNRNQNGNMHTLLHEACYEDSRSPVIPLLLAHPDIDANAMDSYYKCAPFIMLIPKDPPPVFVRC